MLHRKFQVQINTLADRANFVLHGAAYSVALMGAQQYVHSTPIAIAAMATSLLLNFPATNWLNNQMAEAFPEASELELPHGSRRLPQVVERFSRILGFSRIPPLHILESEVTPDPFTTPSFSLNRPSRFNDQYHRGPTAKKYRPKSELKDTFVKLMGKYANAFAYGNMQRGIVVSDPLLKTLQVSEEVVARVS